MRRLNRLLMRPWKSELAVTAIAFTIRSQPTPDLTAETRAAIIHVCYEATREDDFRNLFSYFSDSLHFIGCLGDQIVSHACVSTRWLQPAGLPRLKTAYVDAVATHPDYQGRGYNSAILRNLATAIADDYEIACLETEICGFYARLGWEEWRGPLAGRGENGLVPTPDQTGIMILPLPHTPELNLDASLTVEIDGRIW
jgi:GNAT superfamily N-acetyltransferase